MRSLLNATYDEMTKAFALEQAENIARAPDTTIEENVRLLLQSFVDKGSGPQSGYYMALEGVPERAVELDLLKRVSVPIGDGTHGIVKFELTGKGQSALVAANAALGGKATRYVCDVKYFGTLPPVVFGYPFLWPMSAPTTMINGSICADRRNIVRRVLDI